MLRMSKAQYVVVLVLILLALAPSIALGASVLPTIVPKGCLADGGCTSICDIADLAQNILNAAITIAVFLSAILFHVSVDARAVAAYRRRHA